MLNHEGFDHAMISGRIVVTKDGTRGVPLIRKNYKGGNIYIVLPLQGGEALRVRPEDCTLDAP